MSSISSIAHGATRADWNHFSSRLGLTADLLPVVSNPDAKIHPASAMKDLGKTPSRYNDGMVVGIGKWTSMQATPAQVEAWSSEPDYGICLQTRRVRAIDIDIADSARAAEVEELIGYGCGVLPKRFRSNSGKCLLVFDMPGEFSKRVIKTPHGIIEFLATGQQFIAAGTHPSGVRYEWAGGMPSAVPALTPAEFEVLWQALQDLFGVEGGSSTGKAAAALVRPRSVVDVADPMVGWLDENGWVTGWAQDGRVDVRCPWADGHSSDTGPSSTSYYPAGVGGFAQGHFKCLHASCAGRTDGDFVQATGYGASEFEVLPAAPESELLPAFARDKAGKIKPLRGNLELALTRSDLCGLQIRKDTFRGEIMLAPNGTEAWRSITDSDYTDLCKRMEFGHTGFGHIPKDLIREMVNNVAEHNQFDSAQHWLNGLAWDGVPRVEKFLSKHLGAADTPYTRAVGRYLFSALAGRVLQPGVKADMVPVLVGPQGAGKSTVVAALAPSPDAFLELDLGKADDDQAREMRGVLMVELGELKGLRVKEQAALKSFISRPTDTWVEKYKEHAIRYSRRSVFMGTTNSQEFLSDDTGNRRWLPVEVAGHTTVEAVGAAGAAVARDRDQLWAEGAVMFKQSGIAWQEAERLARAEHAKFETVEPWAAAIGGWLSSNDMFDEGQPRRGDVPFTTEEVLIGAVRIDLKAITDVSRKRVAAVLRRLGFVDHRQQVGKERATRWHRVAEVFA